MSSPSFKILVVDDDFYFREVLQQCLDGAGYKTYTVESVAQAKKAMPLYEPVIVISDIRMPGESGVDLLDWLNLNYPKVSCIIMTGFSDLLDAITAGERGAKGFLPKPFRQDEMLTLIKKILQGDGLLPSGSVPEPSAAEQEAQYCKISIDDFIIGSNLSYNIYIKLESSSGIRYLKVAHSGEDLSTERVRSYKEKGVNHLYLSTEDYQDYLGMAVKVANFAINKSQISPEKKARLLRNTMELMQQQFLSSGLSKQDYDNGAILVESSIKLLTQHDPMMILLESLKEVSDSLFAHSSAVSMIATLIGRKMGWGSPKILSKVSMAGLLHDMGKRQLPKELIRKSRSEMDSGEILQYETHPRRGSEILSESGFVPSDVVQAVFQHHERGNGSGFPNHLPEGRIMPVAKVIAVADEFAHLWLPRSQTTPLDPRLALDSLMSFYSDGLNPEVLIALHAVFDHKLPEVLKKRMV